MSENLPAELTESLHFLRAALEGLAEADAVRRPNPQAWSAIDCVEHLVLAERGQLARLAVAEPAETIPETAGARARTYVMSRAVRVESPERVLPTGRFATLAEALAQFEAARAESLNFAAGHERDLPLRLLRHPFFGTLTGLDAMFVMSGHTRRHADQIRELRASLGI